VVHAAVGRCDGDLKLECITVREDYQADVPLVVIDREDIQQIVMNLLHHAERSMGQAGRGGGIVVRTRAEGSDAVLEVEDDGPGVPPAVRARIFEPSFFEQDEAEPARFDLAIAFGVAKAHLGTLELVPSAAGACFRLTLPGAGFAGPPHRAAG
jgi:signal transduction histidine kinase